MAIAVTVFLWSRGGDYYATHPWDRGAHPDDATLRSSGAWGHGLGIAGTGLILLNLTFMLRRRVSAMRRFGPLRLWMDMHVVTGLLGPLLVLFHTAFLPQTNVAIIAAVALIVLVVTGIVGRFIYAMVPRTLAGAESGPEEVAARLDAARDHIARHVPPDDPLWPELDRLGVDPRVPRTTVGCLLLLPHAMTSTALVRLRLRALARAHPGVALDDLKELVIVRRRLHTLGLYRRLLAWWRGLHRVAALVMIVTMIVHVVVALYLGYAGGEP
ncbi:MAG: hypothetical protein IT385_27090 [Deltaproteobacteria bacterium]|nr:hypothetical protein [Deltaproteobacteria bacterium]